MADLQFKSSTLTFKVNTDASGYILTSTSLNEAAGTKNISFEYVGDSLDVESIESLTTVVLPSVFDWQADYLSAQYRKNYTVTSGTPVTENAKNQTDTETVSNDLERFVTLEVVFGFANGTTGSFAVRPFNSDDLTARGFKEKVKAFTGSNLINNGTQNSCTGIVEAYYYSQQKTPIIDDPTESGGASGAGVPVNSVQVASSMGGTTKSSTYSNISALASETQIASAFNSLYALSDRQAETATVISKTKIDLTTDEGGEDDG